MAATVVKHALYPDATITMALFRDVTNAAELRQHVMKGEFEASLLKPAMIVDPFQVLVAANKAVHLQRSGKMMTRNVHTEILFSLSPSKNISDSFKKFGLGDSDTSALVVIINDNNGSTLTAVTDKVQGRLVDVTEVKELTDSNIVNKVYKLTEEELTISSPLDSITTRIAAKEMAVV
ncbi:EKC/KEOPS complex subunit TPRKB-like [Haliotis rubra]|uniref:EKC/KEOPS complex subunit TPRKB-like n=1 Tax=Haliotis rubra TaxID=36100 RepID=UPI001EE5B638|nr:EKC/KEOPS complex subunit TPRKB-like [Haliotis rubra]